MVTRWEYVLVEGGRFARYVVKYADRTEKLSGDLTLLLNMLGESGWELVGLTHGHMGSVRSMIFKRAIS